MSIQDRNKDTVGPQARRLDRRAFINTAARFATGVAAAPLLLAAEPVLRPIIDSGGDAQAETETPKVTELTIRPVPGTERLTLRQLLKAQNYLQGTVDAIYSTGNQVLTGYVDTLFQRMRAEKFTDIPEVNQDLIKTSLYFNLATKPAPATVPYAPVVDDVVDSSGKSLLALGVYMIETRMDNQQSNSADSIFDLVYTLEMNKARATTSTNDVDAKTPVQIVIDSQIPKSNVDLVVYATNQKMIAYQLSCEDLTKAGIEASAELTDLYSEWQPINELSDPAEREAALKDLIIRKYYK